MSTSIITSALPVLEALQIIANSDVPLSAADVSRTMKLPSSTVHRFLNTLEQAGYIKRYAGSPRFIPGNMPQHLCRALFNKFPLGRIGWPYLQRVAKLSRDSATLFCRIGWMGIRIEEIGDPSPFTYDTPGPAGLSPLHFHLEGTVILACMSETEIEGYRRYLRTRSDDYVRPTSGFWSNLKIIRNRGFATKRLKSSKTHAAFALPIRWTTGEVIGSVGFVGPAIRDRAKGPTEILAALCDIRNELEGALRTNAVGTISPFVHLSLNDIDRRGSPAQEVSGRRGVSSTATPKWTPA
jgi:DNA-binding IclR family transcriptional regulator